MNKNIDSLSAELLKLNLPDDDLGLSILVFSYYFLNKYSLMRLEERLIRDYFVRTCFSCLSTLVLALRELIS